MKIQKVLSRNEERTVLGIDLGDSYILKYVYKAGAKYIKLAADERAFFLSDMGLV